MFLMLFKKTTKHKIYLTIIHKSNLKTTGINQKLNALISNIWIEKKLWNHSKKSSASI